MSGFTAKQVERFFDRATQRPQDVAKIDEMLQALPRGVKPRSVANAVIVLLSGTRPFFALKSARNIPAAAIRAALRRLPRVRQPHTIFIDALMRNVSGDQRLETRWADSISALFATYPKMSWRHARRVAHNASLAADPQILMALQAAGVGATDPDGHWLQVLWQDASDASLDALMPGVERALRDPSGRLLYTHSSCRRYAKGTAATRSMFERIDAELARRSASSGARGLAAAIGLKRTRGYRFSAAAVSGNFDSVAKRRFYASCRVDSSQYPWFTALIWRLDRHRVGPDATSSLSSDGRHRDDLHLGKPKQDDLPGWFRYAAKKLRVEWRWCVVSTSLRGTNRTRLLRWLQG